MAKTIFDWLRPRSATLLELREQREHAITAYQATQAATAAAQDAFDADGSPSAEKALHAARDAERSAFEHLGRSERLLAAAELAEKERQREVNERRLNELEAELGDRTRERELEAHVVQALAVVVDRLLVIRQHREARSRLEHEAHAVSIALGHAPRVLPTTDLEPYLGSIAGELDELARGTGNADARGNMLRRIASLLSPGHVHHHLPRAAE
jgi:hypothetical protein